MTTKQLGERMAKIETTLDFIKERQETQVKHNDRVLEILEDLEKKFDKKFANKWVEKVWIWLGVTLGGVFIVAFANWIINGGLK